MTFLSELNDQFGIAGQLVFKTGPQGFIIAEIKNAHAVAEVMLQGAQIIQWVPKDQKPVIWISPEAGYVKGKSVRGGIPICWPWFGSHPDGHKYPAHGYARNMDWTLVNTEVTADQSTRLVFSLPESEQATQYWPYKAELECSITVGESLEIELNTRNLQDATINITEALHTYFAVGDISKVSIFGLEDTEYYDKAGGGQRRLQQGPVTIEEEVDRIYLGTRSACIIEDPVYKRNIHISKQGSDSTVVWNPWIEKAKKFGDMGDEGYRHMLCVESANAAEDAVAIAPGKTHQLSVSYRIEAQS